MGETYFAIMGDIIDSKKIENRDEVQTSFRNILNKINDDYKKDIETKFLITLGDEFQGLLKTGENALNIIEKIEKAIYPVKMRFGIGVGKLATKSDEVFSLGSDGPVYHQARTMVELLKDKKYESNYSNILISSQSKENTIDNLINSTLALMYLIKSKWTKRQNEIIEVYIKNDRNQYKTAEKLNVEQSTISKALSSSKFYAYQNAKKCVTESIIYLGEKCLK